MPDPNLFDPSWDRENLDGPLRGRAARLGAAAGARDLGVSLYELGPGGAVSPYHLHHANEELVIVLSGSVRLRTPEETRELVTGAVVAFPSGPDGAHRVANVSDEPARVLMISTMNYPEVAEHLTTGAVLTLTAPGDGRAWLPGRETPFGELYSAAMTADLEIDQRGTSTT